jgi:hypothetical protein
VTRTALNSLWCKARMEGPGGERPTPFNPAICFLEPVPRALHHIYKRLLSARTTLLPRLLYKLHGIRIGPNLALVPCSSVAYCTWSWALVDVPMCENCAGHGCGDQAICPIFDVVESMFRTLRRLVYGALIVWRVK